MWRIELSSKTKILGLFLLASTLILGCTKNERVRMFGGKKEITLPPHQRLVNVTWKDTDLWYLTRPENNNEPCHTYTFTEDSTWGLANGTVAIKEVCP